MKSTIEPVAIQPELGDAPADELMTLAALEERAIDGLTVAELLKEATFEDTAIGRFELAGIADADSEFAIGPVDVTTELAMTTAEEAGSRGLLCITSPLALGRACIIDGEGSST